MPPLNLAHAGLLVLAMIVINPDLAEWLLDEGIESMSLNPATHVDTWLRVAKHGG